MNPSDSEPMALVWIDTLDRYVIPHQQYFELYQRGIGLRARRMEQGKDCDDFSVDMMVACWPALKDEIKQRGIEAGRTLSANAESVCQFCGGTGWRDHELNGEKLGVKKCNHI